MLLSKTIKQITKIIIFQIIKKFFSKINESVKGRLDTEQSYIYQSANYFKLQQVALDIGTINEFWS